MSILTVCLEDDTTTSSMISPPSPTNSIEIIELELCESDSNESDISVNSFAAPKTKNELVEAIAFRYSKEIECLICSEVICEAAIVTVLSCGHLFHQFCVNKWFKEYQNSCPLCRKPIFVQFK